MNILFVCTGNTCRSPMAEAILKENAPHINVKSAGVFASNGVCASMHTTEVLKSHNISHQHASQQVTDSLLQWADLVLTMTTSHKESLGIQYPNYFDKYFTLKEYVLETDKEVWAELKTAYANLEEKRMQFVQANHELEDTELEVRLIDHLQEDLNHIRHLEQQLVNIDISDPFGGSLSVYEHTYRELTEHIELLITKLANKF